MQETDRILTVQQPFANLIQLRLKRFETRSRKTNYRGKVFIHISSTPLDKTRMEIADWVAEENTPDIAHWLEKEAMEKKAGVITCQTEIVDCIEITPAVIEQLSETEKRVGYWNIGNFAWKLGGVWGMPGYIKAKGRLGLWKPTPELLTQYSDHIKGMEIRNS